MDRRAGEQGGLVQHVDVATLGQGGGGRGPGTAWTGSLAEEDAGPGRAEPTRNDESEDTGV